MSFDLDKIYALLPAVYRTRDARQELVLRNLLAIIADQVGVLEENLDQLLDDQFIETCSPWVVPYIGDLLGIKGLYQVTQQTGTMRAVVANTISYRRRKGTLSMLEQLAFDVTGWPVRAVEFFQLLATTQYLNHLRPANIRTPNLSGGMALEWLGTPFDTVPHTVDVRHISNARGKYNIRNVGLFFCRLFSYQHGPRPAFRIDDRRYRFSPLGNDMQLFSAGKAEEAPTQLASPVNLPLPITRGVLDANFDGYWGAGKSLVLECDSPANAQFMVCNLADVLDQTGTITGWAHMPNEKVAVDPVLGRIAFPANSPPPSRVVVTCHHGFPGDLGGGTYDRSAGIDSRLQPVFPVTAQLITNPPWNSNLDIKQEGAVEFRDSWTYEQPVSITGPTGKTLEVRAANRCRPLIWLTKSNGELIITCNENSEIILNGLMIAGGTVRVIAAAATKSATIRLRHCTIVPGQSLNQDGSPVKPSAPILKVESASLQVEIDHCILGPIRADPGAHVAIRDSIIDANDPTARAYAALDGVTPGAPLTIENTTVVGCVNTDLLELVSNSILHAQIDSVPVGAPPEDRAPVLSRRRQEGCVRFSCVPPDSLTPRRYHCQPELAVQEAIKKAQGNKPQLPQSAKDAIRQWIEQAIIPSFTTLRYSEPEYAQLRRSCAVEIRNGADDGAEMGAFNFLKQPQRETNLGLQLTEYLPFDLEAGSFFVT